MDNGCVAGEMSIVVGEGLGAHQRTVLWDSTPVERSAQQPWGA